MTMANHTNNLPGIQELVKAEERDAVRARIEHAQRLQQLGLGGKPLPKRGAVMRDIVLDVKEVVEAGVMVIIVTGKTFCCSQEPVDVDALVKELPNPTRSEPTTTIWDEVEE